MSPELSALPLPLRIISKIALYVFRIAITVMPLAFICSGNVAHVTTFFFFQCAARQCFRRSLPAFYALFHNFCPFLPIPAHTPGRYAPAAFRASLPRSAFQEIQLKWILVRPGAVRPCLSTSRGTPEASPIGGAGLSLVAHQRQRPHMSADLRNNEAPANYRQLAIFCISAAVYVSTGCIYKSLVIFMELCPKTV